MPAGHSERWDRFWSKVQVGGPDECWPWLASTVPPWDYGQFGWAKGDTRRAHRVAYELAHGVELDPWPAVVVRHSCDNPPCCNPRHLLTGSTADNAGDMAARRRHAVYTSEAWRVSRTRLTGPKNPARGERNAAAKLTEADVAALRRNYSAGARQVDLAKTYGIGQSHVSRLVRHESWA